MNIWFLPGVRPPGVRVNLQGLLWLPLYLPGPRSQGTLAGSQAVDTSIHFPWPAHMLCAYLLSHVQLFATPWTVARQATLSVGILQARILECIAMLCPPPGDLPNPETELRSPALQVDSLPAEPPGKPKNTGVGSLSLLQGIFLTQESNQVSCIDTTGFPLSHPDPGPLWLLYSGPLISCSETRIICCARCLNPRAGREKASKTMQLAKRGSLLLTRARALCCIQCSGAGQRALSPSCYTNL